MYTFFYNYKEREQWLFDGESCVVLAVSKDKEDYDCLMHFNEDGILDFVAKNFNYWGFTPNDYSYASRQIGFDAFNCSDKQTFNECKKYYTFYHPSEEEKCKFEKLFFTVMTDAYFSSFRPEWKCTFGFCLDASDFISKYRPLKSCIYSKKINPKEMNYPCVLSIIHKETGIKAIVKFSDVGWCEQGLYVYERCSNDGRDRIWYDDDIQIDHYDCYIPTSDELEVFSKETGYKPYCDNVDNSMSEKISAVKGQLKDIINFL